MLWLYCIARTYWLALEGWVNCGD